MKIWERIKKVMARVNPLSAPTKTLIVPQNSPYEYADGQGWRDFLDEAIQRTADDGVLYRDYDEMDNDVPEMSVALDVTTDFVVYPSNTDKSEVFQVKSVKYQEKIDEINKMVKPHHELYAQVRDMLKYGDNVEEIRKTVTGQPLGFKNVDITTVAINLENGDIDPEKYIVQFNPLTRKEVCSLKLDEVFHLCMKTNRRRYSQTGKGVSKLQKARLIYRQVRLMEEGAMIKRLSRANNNYAILVDVGDSSGEEALDYLEKYRKMITRRKYVDQATGKFSYRTNPLSVIEDLYLPTRQGSNAGAVPLNAGSNGDNNVADLEYFQNKMIYATDTPKLLIGKEQDVNAKSTSDTQMIAFFRGVRRIQTNIEPAIIQFYVNALASYGIKDADDLTVYWPVAGTIDEERKWRIEQIKWQIASIISQDLALVDDYYIYKNFFGFTDEQIKEITTRMDDTEAKIQAQYPDVQFDDDPQDPSQLNPDKNPDEETPDANPSENEERVYSVLEKNCKTEKQKGQLRTFIKAILTDSTLRNLVRDTINISKVK